MRIPPQFVPKPWSALRSPMRTMPLNVVVPPVMVTGACSYWRIEYSPRTVTSPEKTSGRAHSAKTRAWSPAYSVTPERGASTTVPASVYFIQPRFPISPFQPGTVAFLPSSITRMPSPGCVSVVSTPAYTV